MTEQRGSSRAPVRPASPFFQFVVPPPAHGHPAELEPARGNHVESLRDFEVSGARHPVVGGHKSPGALETRVAQTARAMVETSSQFRAVGAAKLEIIVMTTVLHDVVARL